MKKSGLLILISLVVLMNVCFAEEKSTKDKEAAQKVLRWYPSALLPPVSDPYIIYWDFGEPPAFNGSATNASALLMIYSQKIGRDTE